MFVRRIVHSRGRRRHESRRQQAVGGGCPQRQEARSLSRQRLPLFAGLRSTGRGRGSFATCSTALPERRAWGPSIPSPSRKHGSGPPHGVSRSMTALTRSTSERRPEADKRLKPRARSRFKQCADRYIEANRQVGKTLSTPTNGFRPSTRRNASRRFSGRTHAINHLPVSTIDTGLVLKVLEPIWTEDAGNSQPRQRDALRAGP